MAKKESGIAEVPEEKTVEVNQPAVAEAVRSAPGPAPGNEAAKTSQAAADDTPAFTLHASDPAELRAFIMIAQNAAQLGFPPARGKELETTLRAFELYEARHRR